MYTMQLLVPASQIVYHSERERVCTVYSTKLTFAVLFWAAAGEASIANTVSSHTYIHTGCNN